jgi:hypothetical protein
LLSDQASESKGLKESFFCLGRSPDKPLGVATLFQKKSARQSTVIGISPVEPFQRWATWPVFALFFSF